MNEYQRVLVEYSWRGETLNVHLTDHVLVFLRSKL